MGELEELKRRRDALIGTMRKDFVSGFLSGNLTSLEKSGENYFNPTAKKFLFKTTLDSGPIKAGVEHSRNSGSLGPPRDITYTDPNGLNSIFESLGFPTQYLKTAQILDEIHSNTGNGIDNYPKRVKALERFLKRESGDSEFKLQIIDAIASTVAENTKKDANQIASLAIKDKRIQSWLKDNGVKESELLTHLKALSVDIIYIWRSLDVGVENAKTQMATSQLQNAFDSSVINGNDLDLEKLTDFMVDRGIAPNKFEARNKLHRFLGPQLTKLATINYDITELRQAESQKLPR